ncbi:unnamed protein product [Dovyalis caffra]|uniref:Uncharacterized protein n=1 Tax=Dovyalis caffra TaxID=77055 RepID=A0AAV1RJK1_9ROSI|nr:unnamed protein product [Dovyalis caffra]
MRNEEEKRSVSVLVWKNGQKWGDESQPFEGSCLCAPGVKFTLLADILASVLFATQHGNFQRLFLDLAQFHVRLDFPSVAGIIPPSIDMLPAPSHVLFLDWASQVVSERESLSSEYPTPLQAFLHFP